MQPQRKISTREKDLAVERRRAYLHLVTSDAWQNRAKQGEPALLLTKQAPSQAWECIAAAVACGSVVALCAMGFAFLFGASL
jgi:succinate dehydrogenase/fumarate reductase-like Fe-S protein